MKIKFFLSALAVLSVISATSCKKGPGDGGQTSITGKVFVERYIGNYHDSINDHWATEQDVYIIYGNDISYGNRTRTGPDGLFEFRYLRAGNYTVYVYSDSTGVLKKSLSKNVDIPDKGIFDCGTFTIKKIN